MAKKEQLSFDAIMSQIARREFKPIYFLMGDESYYIDRITEAILDKVLEEGEKDFNEIVRYGGDVNVADIVNEARFYPSFAQYRVVVIKEAQEVKRLEDLVNYVEKPLFSTILVINYKNGNFDRRKKLIAEVEKHGILFESKKLYDNQLPSWVNVFVEKKGLKIDPKASQMLADFIGADLNRMAGELEKLLITMPQNQTRITPELVERNIGISKEYNNFEFLKAVVQKDILKANRIAIYFEKNPKNNPLNVTLIVLHNFFSNLMLCHYLPNKNEAGVMQGLKIQAFQARDYMFGLRNFSPFKTMEIISLIRECDANMKGIGDTGSSNGDLLRVLLFKMLH